MIPVRRFIKSGANAKAWTIVAAVLLVLALTVSLILTQNVFLRNTFSTLFGSGSKYLVSGDPAKYQYFKPDAECTSKAKTLEMANSLNEKLCEEGIVLLKNEGALLPLYTPESPHGFQIAQKPKISVFGKNSVNILYGGSGSGGANTAGAVTLYQSLEAAGYELNPALYNFYNSSASGRGRPESPGMDGGLLESFSTGETPWASYTQTAIDSFAGYSAAALAVITRIGGEGFDLPRNENNHYLQLDVNEKKMLEEVDKAFTNVILIINCATSVELGFLTDGAYPNIKAALWIATPGMTGLNALGRILNGSINPSGRLIDTYARDFTENPSWQNFGNNMANNGNRYRIGAAGSFPSGNPAYVYYEEGIYVGYRYYETRGYTEWQKSGDWNWYDRQVVYPFGYGLSYTSFTKEIVLDESTAPDDLGPDDIVTVKVKVTNNGITAGKETVQLYYTAPYSGAIEKSQVVLGAFIKTPVIPAGEDRFVTLSIKVRDMASYDWNVADANNSGYKLEAGTYTIRLMNDANLRSQIDFMDYTVAAHHYLNDDVTTDQRVRNLFEDSNKEMKNEGPNNASSAYTPVKVMSRSDFAGTFPTSGKDKAKNKTNSYFNDLNWVKSDTADKPWYIAPEKMPEQASKPMSYDETEVKLYDLINAPDDGGRISVDYNDPRWETLLNQLTRDEMSQLIGTGNFNTMEIKGIDKPKTIDPDGPAGFTNFMEVGKGSVFGTCFYASECIVAATWNTDLALEMGKMIGNESLWGDDKGDSTTPYSGWYAPAMNIHRSPFSGRNWEYYSEDAHVSGKMAAAVVKGAMSKGVYTYLKHFALNDQETNRSGVLTWADEQTMREIYFKPFECAVKEGGSTAVMSSFNRIGKVWAGGDYRLLSQLLRKEWGFKGMVITDYNTGASFMPADQMIRAGGDLNLSQNIQPSKDDHSATQIAAIRQAAKNILYTVANSNAMNGNGEGNRWGYSTPAWIIVMIGIDTAIILGLAVWGFFPIKKYLMNR